MELDNTTKYRTDDLRKFVLAGLKATGTELPKVVRIRYSRNSQHSGWAAYNGRRMQLTLPGKTEKLDLKHFGQVIEHEAAHLRGLRHRDMHRSLLYSQTEAAWTDGLELRMREDKPPTTRTARSEAREARLRTRLSELEKALSSLKRKRDKVATQVRYYDRKTAAKAKTPERTGE